MLNNDTAPEITVPGGTPVPVCHSCGGVWGAGGKYFYLRFRDSGEMGGGAAVAIALQPGKEFPELPPSGFHSVDEVKGWAAKIGMTAETIFARGADHRAIAFCTSRIGF